MPFRVSAVVGLMLAAWPVWVCAQAPHDLQLLPPVNSPVESPPPKNVWNAPAESVPTWYSPDYWYNAEFWGGSVELGINGAQGNADAFSIKTGTKLKRETPGTISKFDASYARTTAGGRTTQDIAIFDAHTEWKFGESPWSWFNRLNMVYDKLRAFDWRLALNGGVGYKFINTDTTKLKGRFGSGVSREFGGPDEKWVPEGVFGMDFERQISKKQKLTATADYFPDWADFSEYRFTFNVGWEVVLDDDPDLSLKLEITDRYDSTSQGLKPNDINYSVLLLWKL